MPIDVSWGNEKKTYTVFHFEGKWTWDEYHRSISDAYALVKDIPYNVNILIDVVDSSLLPQNLLSHIGSTMRQPQKPFDLAVIVTSSRFIEVLARTIERLYGRQKTRFQVTNNLDEAHKILQQHDSETTNDTESASESESTSDGKTANASIPASDSATVNDSASASESESTSDSKPASDSESANDSASASDSESTSDSKPASDSESANPPAPDAP